MHLRSLVIGIGSAALGASIVSYGAWGRGAGASPERLAALYKIDQIEKTWHRAASKKNLDLMMSIWAPKAVATIGGKTYTGKAEIRGLFEKAGPFQPQNHWISDTAAYKIRTTVSGDRGTLYFECHYIDVDTGKVVSVVAADQDVRLIHGKWLITRLISSTPALKP
jgi:ketosteroid isomerase-like protein